MSVVLCLLPLGVGVPFFEYGARATRNGQKGAAKEGGDPRRGTFEKNTQNQLKPHNLHKKEKARNHPVM